MYKGNFIFNIIQRLVQEIGIIKRGKNGITRKRVNTTMGCTPCNTLPSQHFLRILSFLMQKALRQIKGLESEGMDEMVCRCSPDYTAECKRSSSISPLVPMQISREPE